MKISNAPSIRLRSVRQNNLKSISLDIPLYKMTVVTGVSGSGKSSLAFDTLYAEGSRRYMESLSTYARQFLEQIPRPDMDSIQNLPPALALEQRNSITNSRTTLADVTEIYDYLRLLFASLGKQVCKNCAHTEVLQNTSELVAENIFSLPEGTRLYILAPIQLDNPLFTAPEVQSEKGKEKKKSVTKKNFFLGQTLYSKGFQRILVKDEIIDLASAEGQTFYPEKDPCFIVIDRAVVQKNMREESSRLLESLESAFLVGQGILEIRSTDKKICWQASQAYSCTKCGTIHSPPSAPLFSSNSPLGACTNCNGFGETLELNEELIVPDMSKTLRDGAIDPLSKPSYSEWEQEMLSALETRGINTGTRYRDLTEKNKKILWEGDEDFPGIFGYFEHMKQWRYKLHVRVFIRRYQIQKECTVCRGSRLSENPLHFFIGENSQKKNIADILSITIHEAHEWIVALHDSLAPAEKKAANEVLFQLKERLYFLIRVGVDYLKLNRKGNSLSGGEYQRICLATQLGSKLSQTLYVLDEPSIGLHPSDTDKLIKVLHQLRDHGNTLVVVEHDPKVMVSADYLVELGPQAGRNGGELIAAANKTDFLKNRNSLTARYLTNELTLAIPKSRRKSNDQKIVLTNCKSNNLKNITVEIPLGVMVAVTGPSGSGKSTLIHDTLYKSLAKLILKEQIPSHEIGAFEKIQGLKHIHSVSLLDQSPIGRNMRSNPATYLKIYDEIRRIMSCQPQAARAGLTPAHFSFNVDGGRCNACQGEGVVVVDMHFMADLELKCEECDGKRFKKHILEIQYKGKNIHDILHTTVREAFSLFSDTPIIINKLEILNSVGLDYLQLGQSLSTLSGGECQRLKIATSLSAQMGLSPDLHPKLFIFDEPTTGLHIHDIKKLMELFHLLVQQKHSVIFIEHNMDLVAQADWVIDMGPGAGSNGGTIIAQGTPEQVAKNKESTTARYLAEHLR